MANRRFIDFPIAASVGDNDIVLIWQDGLNKQTTKATLLQGSPQSLAGLTDVDISALTNGQILQYNSTTSKWENVDRTDINLSELGDVTIVAPANGQVLVYNSSTSKWENSSGGYVPYTGAVTTVNLGAQSILAGSFVKAGGTSAQFLKADGSVDSSTYGTGTVTSVALTMPSAFSVGGSPITTAGTLAVTGAGTVGQYIRGDGSLADFPATTGGGSSVSYYLNGSVSQGTIGGVAYKELNKTPIFGAGTDISISADGYIASFITDAGDPNKLLIPAGNWNLETYFSASSSGGTPSFHVELYKYNGTTFTLIASSSTAPELIAFGTNLNPYFSTLAVPETVLALTDRLALRYYVTHSGRTITLHTENNHLCQVITTFTTGLTALNGLTSQVQYLTVGTSGTDFAISSASDTHTFNLPTASATNRGALSSADWTTFNNKTSNLGTVTSVGLSSATSGVTIGSTPITTSGTITLAIATASGSQNGLLSSTDWTTFNGKQNALTNPVTGTGTSGTLPKFTGSTTIGNSLFTENGTNGAFGGANYYSGTDVRTFNISATLYPGIGFFANNVTTGNIFSYAGTGNLILNADPNNLFGDSRLILATDNTERLAIFSNGNVTIANSPTDAGYKLDVNGTGRFISSGGYFSIDSNGQVTSTQSLDVATAGGRFTGMSSRGALGAIHIEQTTTGVNGGYIAFRTSDSGSTTPTEKLRITSGGNVGIGTSTPTRILDVRAADNGNGALFLYKGANQVVWLGTGSSTAGAAAGYLGLYNNSNNIGIQLNTQGNSYITGGNVGIGTDSPPSRLSVQWDKSTAFSGLGIYDSQAYNASNHGGTVTFGGTFNSGGSYTEWSAIGGMKSNTTDGNVSGDINFYTRLNSSAMTQRMIITSSGDVLIDTNSAVARLTVQYSDANNNGLAINETTSAANSFLMLFRSNSVNKGSIQTNIANTGVLYNTTSDYRFKEDLKDYSGIEIVSKIKTYDFKWKDLNFRSYGVLAHELQILIPDMVGGIKDQIDKNGVIIPQGVDYGKLTPILIKAIQELKQEIDTLKN
jgi:hypothetical protein